MPTLAPLPRTSESLCVTTAPAPTAVALVMPAAPFEFAPTKVLSSSVVFESPALRPTNVLVLPVVFASPAPVPMKELLAPSVLVHAGAE